MDESTRVVGEQVFFRGKGLYRPKDPLLGAELRVPDTLEEACLYLVLSPVLGHGLGVLLERLPVTSRVLLLEADSSLHKISTEVFERYVPRDPRLELLPLPAGPSLKDCVAVLEVWLGRSVWSCRSYRVLALNRAVSMQADIYRVAELEVWLGKYIRNFWQNRLVQQKLGPLWIRNSFRNLSRIPEARGLPSVGGPVVLAAAGTSLAEHLDWLRQERANCYIIAVDTALLPLLQSGILPDLVVNLDAQTINLHDFYGVQDLLNRKQLRNYTGDCSFLQCIDLSADPRSFAFGRGFCLSATRFFPSTLWSRLEGAGLLGKGPGQAFPLAALGSVSITALAIALACRPALLLFVGYDFAYPLDLHHIRGTSIYQNLLGRSSRFHPVNSCLTTWRKRKEPVLPGLRDGFYTDPVLSGYALQLQQYLRSFGGQPYYRLEGPLSLDFIPLLGHREASEKLRDFRRLPPRKSPEAPGRSSGFDLIWKNRRREYGLLIRLIEDLSRGREVCDWESGDYLLQCLPPQAGWEQPKSVSLARVLELARDFSRLLEALLR